MCFCVIRIAPVSYQVLVLVVVLKMLHPSVDMRVTEGQRAYLVLYYTRYDKAFVKKEF